MLHFCLQKRSGLSGFVVAGAFVLSWWVLVNWQSQIRCWTLQLLHVYTETLRVCAQARESWLIIKRQGKRAHAAKVFCNLRGLTQRGFNTCNTTAMPQSATQIHFKGFSAYSLTYLRRTKWLHCNIYPIKPSPCSPASSFFFFLFSCFGSIQFELAYLLQPPCNGPCLPLSSALAHLPIAVETRLLEDTRVFVCLFGEGGRLYWTHNTHT